MSDWKSRATAVDPAQPGVQAIGSPEGATGDWKSRATSLPASPEAEPDVYDKLGSALGHVKLFPGMRLAQALGETEAGKVVRAGAGKVMDYPAGIARTMAAYLAGAVKPGPNPIGATDGWAAITGNAPGVGEQAEKLGVANKAIPLPGETHPHISTKDLLNIGGNAALDPMMWGGAQKLGKEMYNSAINPIEVEGQRFNKSEVGDVLNKNEIKNPLTLRKTVQQVVNKNMNLTDATEAGATELGANGDAVKAMSNAQAFVDNLKSTARAGSDEMKMANEMQAEINNHLQRALPKGSSALPNSPVNMSQWKTDAGNKVSQMSRDVSRRGTSWDSFYKAVAHGLKNETEGSIGQSLGPKAQAEYQQTNSDTGKLLSTGKAQQRVQGQAQRLKDAISTPVPTGTEGFAGALAAALTDGKDPLEMLGKGAFAVGLQKAAKAAQLAAMPTGYALRNTPMELTKAAAIENAIKKPSPWAQQGDQNGQK